jgi:itaconate CoA-transferase
LHEEINDALSSLAAEEVLAWLDAADIANAVLRDMHEFASPQLSGRNRWPDVDSPVGPLRILIPPVSS